MPNLKLTELPTLSPINFTSTDLIYIVDSELNTSNKIPFNVLAGDKLTLLSAYDIQNTTNLEFLSTNIEDNTTTIGTLNAGVVTVNTDIETLSSTIDSNFSTLSNIQVTKASQTDVNLLSTDVLTLSGKVGNLESDIGDSFTKAESLSQGTVSLTASNDDNTVLNLGLDTFSSPDFTGLTVDSINVPNTITNIRTLSGFSGTVTTASVTQTKHVPINIGGTTYKLLLAD